MTTRIRTAIALLMLSHGLVACSDRGSPTAPSALPAADRALLRQIDEDHIRVVTHQQGRVT